MLRALLRKLLCLGIALVLVMSIMTGCSKDKDTPADNQTKQNDDSNNDSKVSPTDAVASSPTEAPAKEPTVIRWGWHNMSNLDPYWVDEATGEYTMDEASRQAALAALEKVKEELNVEVEYVQYVQDVRSELITSVLANDPVCDIAGIWGGAESTILAQNILQELDEYAYLYEDDEYSWMWYDKIYGHNYFLTWKQTFVQRWPLLYNITMIEQVDSLKNDKGETVYPHDLFFEGKWTWSTFKDYLAKIQAHYANVPAPDSCAHDTIQAYETDWRFAALSATYAAGGAIYGVNGLQIDSPQSIAAAQFIADLKNTGLMTDPGTYSDGYIPVWTKGGSDFQDGGTVFTDCPDWWITGSASAAADRGEAIGIVAYPRPDDMPFDDENYRQVMTAGDSIAILKGVSKEKTQLALEFFRLYWKTYYEVYGGVSNIVNYKNEAAANQAAAYGFDIFNEKYGDNVLKSFQYVASKCVANDYADLIGVRGTWDVILGKGLYGIEGMPAYDVAIAANKDQFTKVINDMETILASGEIHDNIAPSIVQEETVALPKGTDPTTVDWSIYFTAEDAVDGVLDTTTASYDYSATDFSAVGVYNDGLKAVIKDAAGNEASRNVTVNIYDPDNKTAPTLEIKAEYRTIKLDEDTSEINWAGDFVESAVDADGIDVKSNVTADLSDLDTTTPGEYDLPLTVKDFAGNETTVTIKVQVKAGEE